jgi:hypothetical protein
MRKYFFTIDKIVFSISLACLIWIICFKFWWTSDSFNELLFQDADIFADITYTVFTSVIAAGIFYFFTIYLQRIIKTIRARPDIRSCVSHMNTLSSSIITQIPRTALNQKYTVEDFMYEIKTNKEIVQDDFIRFYDLIHPSTAIFETLSYQMTYINVILVNFSDLLPDKFLLPIKEFSTQNFQTLKLFQNLNSPAYITQLFYMFHLMLSLSTVLEEYDNY